MRGSASQAMRLHPWGLGENIHVFDSPANPPTPTLHTWLVRMGKRRSKPSLDNVMPRRSVSNHGSDLPPMRLPGIGAVGPTDGWTPLPLSLLLLSLVILTLIYLPLGASRASQRQWGRRGAGQA